MRTDPSRNPEGARSGPGRMRSGSDGQQEGRRRDPEPESARGAGCSRCAGSGGHGRRGDVPGAGRTCRGRQVCPPAGRPGAHDRRAGRGGGPLLRGRPLRLRCPGGPEQRVLGRDEGPAGALPARDQRGVGERHGRRLGAGHRRGRGLLRRARAGADQRDDRHRRGAARQRPDRRHRHRRQPGPERADRPGPLAAEHGPAPADLQDRARGPPPGRDPAARSTRHYRIAVAGEPGPVAVVIPFPFYTEAWDYDCPVPPPYPLPFDEAAYRPGARRMLADRRPPGRDLRRDGLHRRRARAGGVAELLQAPVATSVSGKGCIPDAHPLAVGWGYGKQGTRAAERAFKDVDLVLAVGVRYSEVSTANYAIPQHDTLIHVDANPQQPGPERPRLRQASAPTPGSSSTACSPTPPAVRRPACPALWKKIRDARELDRRENTRVRIDPRRRSDDLPDPAARAPRARGADLRRRDRLDALGLRGDRGPGPAPLLHPGEQPEHGLGDPRVDRRAAGPARPPGGLRSPATAAS